jgi:tetratricopeptide (TPR) repeat protein
MFVMHRAFVLVCCAALAVTHRVAAQELSELTLPPNGDNQRAEVSQWIGPVKITIAYHSPRVHLQGTTDRTGRIWGGLVKFGLFDDGFGPSHATPWRAGANETTTITFSEDVKVEGQDVKAGTYALFLKLDPSKPWTLILNRHVGWGSFQYDSTKDVLHAAIAPQDAPFTEFLTYAFTDRLPSSALAYLQWENKRIPFKIDVPDVNERYLAQIRQDLESWPGFNYQNWQKAAQFAVAANLALDEALVWANRAIYEPFRNAAQGRQDFSTFATKASVLHALGRDAEADTTMDRALRSEGATAPVMYQVGMGLLNGGRKERALDVFKLAQSRFPDDKFWPYVGLARAYTATGDKKSAIASWETAIQNTPPSQANAKPRFEEALKALKAK